MEAFLTNLAISFGSLCFAWAFYKLLDCVFGERTY